MSSAYIAPIYELQHQRLSCDAIRSSLTAASDTLVQDEAEFKACLRPELLRLFSVQVWSFTVHYHFKRSVVSHSQDLRVGSLSGNRHQSSSFSNSPRIFADHSGMYVRLHV